MVHSPRWVAVCGGLLLAAAPLAAQEPASRDTLEAFQDSLSAISDTTALAGLERRLVDIARTDRDNTVLHLKIGLVNLRIGDLGGKDRYEDAASEFNWATELEPRWPWAWYGLGLAEIGVGEPEIALVAGLQNMFGKDHMTRGAMAFAHAAEVDPSFVRGLVELAHTALAQRINIKLDLAREALRVATATAAGKNPQVLLYRGRVEREIGDLDTAAAVLRQYVAAPNANRDLGLLELARTLFITGDSAGREAYYSGAATSDTLALSEYRKDLAYIAPDSALARFDSLSGERRVEFLHQFWNRRDHQDLRREGERLAEHYRRIHYAHRNFALVSTKRHYDIAETYRSNNKEFDDRGVIYIRHGEPTDRARLVMPGVELNESWKYARPDGDLVFHFVAREDVQDYKLVESVYDVLGFQGALRAVTSDSSDRELVERLLDSRTPLDPLYSRLRTSGSASLVRLAGQERSIGQRSIAQGTRTDSYQLTYAAPLQVRTDVMAVGRENGHNLLQVTWAIAGRSLTPINHPRGHVYPVRVRVNVVDASGRPVAWLDTTKMFLSSDPVPPGENLVDRLAVPVPAGRLHYRIAVEQEAGHGAVMASDTIEVGEFDGSDFTVSSVVLGWRNANLRWLPGGRDTVFFNPTGVYRRNSEMELYYEVYGLTRGTPYNVELTVGKQSGGRPDITVRYEERSDSVVTRSRRSVVLEKVSQGTYVLQLTITTPDGRRAVRRAAFEVSRDRD